MEKETMSYSQATSYLRVGDVSAWRRDLDGKAQLLARC